MVYLSACTRVQSPFDVPPYLIWEEAGDIWAQFYRTDEGYLFRLIGLSDFMISFDGQHCKAYPVPGLDADTLDHIFRHQVRPLLWNRQGKLVFHASCVEIGGNAYAFMGDSGLGKSTLATAFAQRGYPFLTDDGLLVGTRGSDFYAFPNDAIIRLWQASSEALLPVDHPLAAPISYTDKLGALCSEQLPHCDKPLPLKAVFILENNGVEEMNMTTISGAKKHTSWANYSFNLDVWDKEAMSQNFDQIAHISNQVPSYSLDYPRAFAQLDRIIHDIVGFIQNEKSA